MQGGADVGPAGEELCGKSGRDGGWDFREGRAGGDLGGRVAGQKGFQRSPGFLLQACLLFKISARARETGLGEAQVEGAGKALLEACLDDAEVGLVAFGGLTG